MIKVFLNEINAKLALKRRKPTLKLIFFILFNKFTILLLILLSVVSPLLSISILFLLTLVRPGLARANKAILFGIKGNKAANL